jgi:hypothetical protein
VGYCEEIDVALPATRQVNRPALPIGRPPWSLADILCSSPRTTRDSLPGKSSTPAAGWIAVTTWSPPKRQGCGPHGTGVESLTACDITSGCMIFGPEY